MNTWWAFPHFGIRPMRGRSVLDDHATKTPRPLGVLMQFGEGPMEVAAGDGGCASG